MAGQLARVVCALALLGTAVASRLQDMRQVTCPDGFEACAGKCYQQVYRHCWSEGFRTPVPKTQEEINCLLDQSSATSLPVLTFYENTGDSFENRYSRDESAPEELVGELGPGGTYDDVYDEMEEMYVLINREIKKLERSEWLGRDRFAYVCEPKQ